MCSTGGEQLALPWCLDVEALVTEHSFTHGEYPDGGHSVCALAHISPFPAATTASQASTRLLQEHFSLTFLLHGSSLRCTMFVKMMVNTVLNRPDAPILQGGFQILYKFVEFHKSCTKRRLFSNVNLKFYVRDK